jgi:hypothetical protein
VFRRCNFVAQFGNQRVKGARFRVTESLEPDFDVRNNLSRIVKCPRAEFGLTGSAVSFGFIDQSKAGLYIGFDELDQDFVRQLASLWLWQDELQSAEVQHTWIRGYRSARAIPHARTSGP